MLNVIYFNEAQANDFIMKYMQSNIRVTDISKDSEDGIYFVTISSGKLFNKKTTTWQFRPWVSYTDKILGITKNIGLCFGRCQEGNRAYNFYDFDRKLMEKANDAVQKAIEKWEGKSPI